MAERREPHRPLAACAIGLRAAPEEGCVLRAAPRTVGNDALWSLAVVSTSESWAASSLVWFGCLRKPAEAAPSEHFTSRRTGRRGVEAASEPRAASALGTASAPVEGCGVACQLMATAA